MAINIKRFLEGLRIFPKTSTSIDAKGELEVIDSTGKIQYHNGTSVSPLVTEAHAAPITGKTLLEVDNLQLDGNTIASTDANGNIVLDPNGNGNINLTAGGTGVVNVGSSSVNVNASGNVNITGDLDVDNLNINGNTIISTDTNGDIVLTPDGSGLLKTDNLALGTNTISSTNTDGNIILDPNGNGNIALTAGGTGLVQLGSSSVDVNASGSMNITGDLDVDNLNLNGNSLTSTNADGSITLDPNGNGNIVLTAGGTGLVQIGSSSIDADASGNMNITGSLSVDNIDINGNTVSSTDANGNIVLDPNGTGLIAAESQIRLPEIATPSTPSSGYGNIYFKTDGYLYQQNDNGTETRVGAGEAGVNYILNGTFESDADGAAPSGWSTYDDAAAAPVDGTGGTVTTTWLAETDNALRGNRSVNLVKDAANRQGEGAAYDFTVATVDKGQVLEISFDYTVVSGTYANGDLTVYIIQDPSGTPVVIQPVSYTIPNVTASLGAKWRGTFQTATNVSSYRLCIHIASTSASAYTLKFDSFSVGPQLKSYGPFISDWTAYTPTYSGVGSASHLTAQWRRVGDNLEVYGSFVSGTPAASTFSITLPSGLSVNSSKWSNTGGGIKVGEIVKANGTLANIFPTTSNGPWPLVVDTSSSSTVVYASTSTSAGNYVKENGSAFLTASITTNFRFEVPITGWSSGMQLSSDAGDSRVVAWKGYRNATQSITTGSAQKLQINTSLYDTHAAFDGTTNYRWTAPVKGKYRVSGTIDIASNATGTRYLYLYYNGGLIHELGRTPGYTSDNNMFGGSTSVDMNAGDYLEFYIFQNSGGSLNTAVGASYAYNHFEIERISTSNQQIAASESVNFIGNNNAGTTLTHASSTAIPMATVIKDSHASWSSGSNYYVVPVSGVYDVKASALIASKTYAAGDTVQTKLVQSGSTSKTTQSYDKVGVAETNARIMTTKHSTQFRCLAGDTIQLQIRVDNAATANQALDTGLSVPTELEITRVGNY